ncbi:hypothetical protein JD844_013605 [Phrynosoma platyrhinos]|uniref:B30.2/SPRY domain-containing protein n=1 Tax=Phrynosoma platyrhinos TaxID=52577 RepID=A0ABQ7TM53_PHRPL|nr:hypothetical protein JD844_013605 [Phrynosoma platyrhinos]
MILPFFQDQICGCLENLRKEREQLLASKAVTEKESQDLLRGKAVSQFRQLHQFLEDQEKLLLAHIEEVEKEIILKREEHLATLSREVSFLGNLIQEMEEKRRQPASEFLQDIGRTLKKTEERRKFCSSWFVPLALEWRISEMYDINPFLEDVMKKFKDLFLESKRMKEVVENTRELYTESTSTGTQPNISRTWEDVLLSGAKKVNVTLAPDTAFPRLILTEDLKSVRWDKKYQALPEHLDRFNLFPFVLGREEFSAGSYYWDVFVGCQEHWAVGVARKSVRRKGPVRISPKCGIWAVGNSDLPLCLDGKLQKIRVFLSCSEGQVAFYNVDTQEHLYTFTGAPFSGEIILPFFRVFLSGYLRILP